jgi:hypothetical protein
VWGTKPDGEKAALELGHHAGVSHLLDVVDLRHPAHHLLTPELPKRREVEMPKPFIPAPGLIVSTSGEVEGPGHLHVKHIQPVAPTVDLSEKTTATVLDSEHPSINLHSRATLVEPAKADDGVPKGWDVVHLMEKLVLVGLSHGHHRPDAADLHRGLIAELDGALNAMVQVGEVLDASGHVVRGAAVEVPSLKLIVVGAIAEESSRTRLIDVE